VVCDGAGVPLPGLVGAGVAVGRGVGVTVGAGVAVGDGVGFGVGAGVGLGVGAGVGVGVGLGVGTGVGVGEDPTAKESEIVANVPEPHDVDVAPPGLSAAVAIHVSDPAVAGVPEIRKTATSPTGRPTSGFLSDGFLKVTMV
jgi:hypothetical protein